MIIRWTDNEIIICNSCVIKISVHHEFCTYKWATLQFEASKSNSLRWLDTISLLLVPYSVSDDKVLHFKLEILSDTTIA